jgi:hypothetical protein
VYLPRTKPDVKSDTTKPRQYVLSIWSTTTNHYYHHFYYHYYYHHFYYHYHN